MESVTTFHDDENNYDNSYNNGVDDGDDVEGNSTERRR